MASNARDLAVTALVRWEREQTYSNVMLDALLQSAALPAAEAAFTTQLVYGVMERMLTIDWLLEKNSRQPIKKCHPTVRAVLRVAVYQIVYLDKIPASAAVNEAVKQVKAMKQPYAAGYVNGLLRAVSEAGPRLLASLPQDLKGHSLRYSIPLALLQAWDRAYGRETAVALAKASDADAPTVVRVNTLKTTVESFCEQLKGASIAFCPIDGLPAALIVEDAAALRAIPALSDHYYVQDAASQWAVQALAPQPHEKMLDMCAAPGGKSFTAAMHMEGQGRIVSCDLYDEKVKTMAARAKRYGIDCMQTVCRDASSPLPVEWEGRFDRVICDVPCSGFGVIRRRPEIRYKSLMSFAELPALQYTILCEAAKAVKAGGVLQYSTCTLRPEENEEVTARFLNAHPSFLPRPLSIAHASQTHELTLMPHLHQTDGFYVASFRKEG